MYIKVLPRRSRRMSVRIDASRDAPSPYLNGFISDKVFSKSYCRSQLPHKSVHLSFSNADIKNKLTDLCGNSRVAEEVEEHPRAHQRQPDTGTLR